MDESKSAPPKELPLGLDAKTEEDYASLSKLLQEFTSIPNIDKAWTFKSNSGIGSQAMFSISQANLLANKRRQYILSANISEESSNSVNFRWAPFPVEMTGVSTVVPSPSGLKLFVVRNPENESPTRFEIWNQGQVEKEFNIPQSVHGSVYTDGWLAYFHSYTGISCRNCSILSIIDYYCLQGSRNVECVLDGIGSLPSKPTFNDLGYIKGGSTDKDCGSWKGQGEWEEDWGETYAGKRQPALFVIDINSGEVLPVKGISKSLSTGQVVWAPSTEGIYQYLVFVGWSSSPRKLGIKYCYNRPSGLYAVRVPIYISEVNELELKQSPVEDSPVLNLTQSISSAFFPSFSPDGRFLVFLSASSSVDSGAHSATDSLHKIDWPVNGQLSSEKVVDVPLQALALLECDSLNLKVTIYNIISYTFSAGNAGWRGLGTAMMLFKIAMFSLLWGVTNKRLVKSHRLEFQIKVRPPFPSPEAIHGRLLNLIPLKVPVVQCAEDGCFPGLYCSNFIRNPWLSDGCTMIISSVWGSCQVILSVNVLSGDVSRISPIDSNFAWNLLTLDGDSIIAVSSSPVDVPQIKYGYLVEKETKKGAWGWSDVSSPIFRCSEKVKSLLSSRQFTILNIPVKDVSDCLTKGASKPFEAIFVSRYSKESDACDPLIVALHGGPHSVLLSSFMKSFAFLSSLGYSLLIVNYRGSLGFGDEALQSLPGKVGSQDVNDVLTAVDHVIDMGLANPSKVAVIGGSHGGFLTTHLIGQAPDKFVAAAARNPVCNLASMVGTTDIPDWCYVETYGVEGKTKFTEAPSAEDLALFHSKSPISHISKVKTPTIFLLGAQDLRVPLSNGLQYARALKEKGVDVKVLMFPNDVHGIDRPQSDFEGYINIGTNLDDALGNKERSITLKEQSSRERALEIFEWFNRECGFLDERRKWSHADECLCNEMRIKRISAVNSKYGTLIDVYSKAGLKEEAFHWLENMNELLPDEVTIGIVVQINRFLPIPALMDASKSAPPKELPLGLDAKTEEDYASLSKLLQEFTSMPNIDKAWTFKSNSGIGSQAMFSISQANLLANKRTKYILSANISKESSNSVNFQWEMTGVSTAVPSPSGLKLFVVRNPENESPTRFEIWNQGISCRNCSILRIIDYYCLQGSRNVECVLDGIDKDCGSWKGQGEWEEDWGETYAGKRQPALFVIDINSGQVQPVKGILKSLSIGQVVWAPSTEGIYQESPIEDSSAVNLTKGISSAFFPSFSPNGKFFVFLSSKSSVDSGAHCATDSLHRIDWPVNGQLSSAKIIDVIPVVQCADNGSFPGLYCPGFIHNPWLSDGCTMISSSIWGSSQVILSVNVLRGDVSRISPADSNFSWDLLTLDGYSIIAVSSSPVDVPQIKYGYLVEKATNISGWGLVKSLVSSHQFSILNIPVKDVSDCLTKGASKPFEAIFVSRSSKKNDAGDPLIVVLHGGPRSVSLSSFLKSLAFLSSIGYTVTAC
ncbi:unnamed protein product [Dovyalis caffra]|uniref:acylaminoacyl-peptidase n=1 Tax=Dovyalis caffra TaxID=77055 RepID=A0AAV1QZJ4_9ROSI|nr:unnamed protein product [Dovyalis caffra]